MAQKPRVLVVGGSGFIGSKLVQTLKFADFPVVFTYASRQIDLGVKAYQVDLIQAPESLNDCIQDFQPEFVIYCAIPPINTDGEFHRKVSVDGVRYLLENLKKAVCVIYFSTGAVFNGKGPHNEKSEPQRRYDRYQVYSDTRRQGEIITLNDRENALVIRTDTVNGRDVHGNLNFRLKEVIDKLKNGQPIKRFVDRFITPTLVDNLAASTVEMLGQRGILHLAGRERITDYALTRLLAKKLGVDEGLVVPENMLDNPAWMNSPHDNSLDTTFAQSLLKTRLMDIQEQLDFLFDEL